MLNEEQKAEVAKWFAAGATLDEIQKRIKSEFAIHMTYLDLRLMVAELPQPQEEEDIPEAGTVPAAGDYASENVAGDDAPMPTGNPAENAPKRYDLDAPDADEGKGVPDVQVEMNAFAIPGTIANGEVTFSDGVKAKWYVDVQGRMGIGDTPEGYRPSPADAAIFQSRLMELFRSRGMA